MKNPIAASFWAVFLMNFGDRNDSDICFFEKPVIFSIYILPLLIDIAFLILARAGCKLSCYVHIKMRLQSLRKNICLLQNIDSLPFFLQFIFQYISNCGFYLVGKSSIVFLFHFCLVDSDSFYLFVCIFSVLIFSLIQFHFFPFSCRFFFLLPLISQSN